MIVHFWFLNSISYVNIPQSVHPPADRHNSHTCFYLSVVLTILCSLHLCNNFSINIDFQKKKKDFGILTKIYIESVILGELPLNKLNFPIHEYEISLDSVS